MLDVHRAVHDLALDLLVVVYDGTQKAQVRLGSFAPLPGPWRRYGLSIGYPQTIRIPYDAFLAENEASSLRPDRVGLDWVLLVANAAATITPIEVQRK